MKERAIDPAPSALGDHLLGEVPEPVLFNAWKHHAGALRRRVAEAAAAGEAGLDALARGLVVLGTDLMDLYAGPLSPAEIAAGAMAILKSQGRLEPAAFRAWVEDCGGYGVVELPEDGSRWVTRFAEGGGRYVHVHPARWAPQTRRVRANVLRSAVMALAHAALHGGDPLDLGRVNLVRARWLGLSPVPRLADDQGLHAVIGLLRG